jgi:hypothetical protein
VFLRWWIGGASSSSSQQWYRVKLLPLYLAICWNLA